MKMKSEKKISSLLLCMVLIVAMALFTTGCNGSAGRASSEQERQDIALTDDAAQEENSIQTDDDVQAEGNVLGEGNTKFILTVVDKEGVETQFEIHTDKETVGEALEELGLIAGEESEFGLYIKTVNGITADYDKDGVYWAFYINGEYAQTGIDSTAITEGDDYSLKVE
ncbi:MAG: DUF4430 domain-containing protein [Lachnospiraceae bacterium]|nr:DUF4430 domain-containing protein [Lachnospiraceae bacterium]